MTDEPITLDIQDSKMGVVIEPVPNPEETDEPTEDG